MEFFRELWLRVARSGSGAKATPLAARPVEAEETVLLIGY